MPRDPPSRVPRVAEVLPGDGDGRTTEDVAGADAGTADAELSLRAERSGDGPGRTYQIVYHATDASGNPTPALGLVTVPHDLGSGPEPLQVRLEMSDAAGMARVYWASVAGARGYDVIRGDVGSLAMGDGRVILGDVKVLARGTGGASVAEDGVGGVPALGQAFFYLVQYEDAQSRPSGFGTESAPLPRAPTSCEGGCPGAAAVEDTTGSIRHGQ